MSVPRFFVPPEWLGRGDPIALTGDLARQLGKVLRLQPGDRIVLLDNSGRAYEAELLRLEPQAVYVHLLRTFAPQTEPRLRLILYQALPKGERFEWVLQKGTELGISAFVPLITERSVLQAPERIGAQRLARWRRIIQEAAEQAGRARLPELAPVQTFEQALATLPAQEPCLMAALAPQAVPLHAVLEPLHSALPRAVSLFIGPEGDFSPAEVSRAVQAGARLVSLGPRILRTETAAIAASAIILYTLGEMAAPQE